MTRVTSGYGISDMTFNKYYQDELTFLRELGEEFSQANPKLAPFLSARASDPDVERLLEGFAFLSGRIREKLDDELPELTHNLIQLLWPHYLRPLPSMSVVEFKPIVNAISERHTIVKGTEVDSTPVDGTSCRFRTCTDVDVYPLTLESAELQRTASGSTLTLDLSLHPGAQNDQIDFSTLRLYLHGKREQHISQTLYLWLCRHLARVQVSALRDGETLTSFTLGPHAVTPAGMSEEEGMLPYPPNAFTGYRLLQEYFAFPEKFHFVDLHGLRPIKDAQWANKIRLVFEFERPIDEQLRVTREHIRLFSTPVVNLFAMDADPIRVEQNKVEYRVRPSAKSAEHFQLYSIDRVSGRVPGTGKAYVYTPFESFERSTEGGDNGPIYYRTRIRPAVVGQGVETYIAFVNGRDTLSLPPTEIISLEITATNRHVVERLQPSTLCRATGNSPDFATFENITHATPSYPPPLEPGLHWRLISNMAINYVSLASVDSLRTILSTYDFRAFFDRQAERASKQRMDAIEQVHVEPADAFYKGSVMRGLHTALSLRESHFAGEGDMYLFASILNHFLALAANINSFHRLEVRGVQHGEVYRWPAMMGQQPLV